MTNFEQQTTQPIDAEQVKNQKKEKAKKIALKTLKISLYVLQSILLAFLVVLCLANLVSIIKKNKGEKVPTFLGFAYIYIDGHSMSPTMDYGDLIVIHNQKEYAVNDIITYRSPENATVTHRIIDVFEATETSPRKYQTKGDYEGNSIDSTLLTDADIYGKSIIYIKGGGDFLVFMQSPVGLILLLVIGVLIIELPTIINAIKKAIIKRRIKDVEKNASEIDGLSNQSNGSELNEEKQSEPEPETKPEADLGNESKPSKTSATKGKKKTTTSRKKKGSKTKSRSGKARTKRKTSTRKKSSAKQSK